MLYINRQQIYHEKVVTFSVVCVIRAVRYTSSMIFDYILVMYTFKC